MTTPHAAVWIDRTGAKRFHTVAGARIVSGITLALGCMLMACTGPDGAAGPPGAPGALGGQGTAGTAGPAGSAGVPGGMGSGMIGVDGGLPTSCLSPCHGFGGIVEQYKTSAHYAVYVVNLDSTTAAEWTAPGSACGNCHAQDAFDGRVVGKVGTAGDAGVTNVTRGELEYRAGASSAADSTYTGNATVAAVACVTCHAVTDATDPHRTGLPFVSGSFPQQVPTGADDVAYIEKSPTTAAVTGAPLNKIGASNTCIWCHKSRKDVTNFITADQNLLTSTHWGPHEGPQADVYSGLGGYEYAGLAYGSSTHTQKLGCIDCHMPGVATNSNAPNHSFAPQISACQSCHIGATTFDIGGGQGQIKLALFELQKALNDAGYLTRSAAAPYLPLSGSQLTDGAFDTDLTSPGAPDAGVPSLSAAQAGALYNYLIITRGGALGVHNPKYVRQLIFDSYFAIKGVPPTTLARPE